MQKIDNDEKSDNLSDFGESFSIETLKMPKLENMEDLDWRRKVIIKDNQITLDYGFIGTVAVFPRINKIFIEKGLFKLCTKYDTYLITPTEIFYHIFFSNYDSDPRILCSFSDQYIEFFDGTVVKTNRSFYYLHPGRSLGECKLVYKFEKLKVYNNFHGIYHLIYESDKKFGIIAEKVDRLGMIFNSEKFKGKIEITDSHFDKEEIVNIYDKFIREIEWRI